MFSRIVGSALLCLIFITNSVFAEDQVEFDDERYEVYYGDVDNDGDATDIYFRGLKRLIIIHGEIAIPIFAAPRDSYALIKTGSGYLYQKVDLAVSESQLTSFRRLTSGRDIYYADFDGSGSLDAFIRGADTTSAAVLMHGGKPQDEALAVVYEGAYGTGSENLSDRSRAISLKDVNRDGRIDLVLADSEAVYADVAFLNGSGGFPFEQSLDLNPSTFPATLVGSSAAEFRVSESGAATYNVPIYSPPGIAGVVPSVSLNYSSAGGNGEMGIGWNVSAVSSISRCRPTLFQDGEALPITLTASDRFCLDGQRLMVQGTAAYGALNAIYKTEIDNFEYIKSVGGSAGNPNYFIIIGKDGSKRTYGGAANSRQEIGGATLTWSLSETVDNTGLTSNKIHFSYAGESQGFRLTKIEYANKKVGIDFEYDDRNDILVSYTGGHKLTADKRLKKVTVKDNTRLIREYHVRYQNPVRGNEFSRVASIQECTATNSVCLPPLSFDWEMQDLSVSDNRSLLTDLTPSTTHTVCEPEYGRGCIPISENERTQYTLVDYKTTDINGDNCLDLVYSLYHRSKREFTVGYKKANSSCTGFEAGRFGGVGTSSPHYLKYDISEAQNTAQLNIIDYNSDGRSDLAIKREENASWEIHLAKPTADGKWFISQSSDASVNANAQFFMDMNADALPDAVWFDNRTVYSVKMRRASTSSNPMTPNAYFSGPSETTLSGSYFPEVPDDRCRGRDVSSRQWSEFPEKPILGDFNGDGKLDIGAYFRASVNCRNGGDPGPILDKNLKPAANVDYSSGIEGGVSLESNSVASSRSVTIYTSTKLVILTLDGTSWKKVEDVNLGTYENDRLPAYIVAQDLNSDGLTDLIYRRASQTSFLISKGTVFGLQKRVSVPSRVEDNNLGFNDYNNDGYTDLYYSDSGRLKVMTWNVADEEFNEAEDLGAIGDKDAFFFADLDGDGISDQFVVTNGLETENPAVKKLYIQRDRSNGVHNKIGRYDNGFGSETIISYKRLNEDGNHYERKEVGFSDTERSYTRRYCEPLDGGEPGCYWRTETVTYTVNDPTEYYRALYNPFDLPSGSNELAKPVFDLNPAFHVVTRVQSTSPTATNPNAKAAVSYRYSEAKAQAGGRGYLGFRSITTVDEQTLVETESEYYQRFPLSGQAKATVVKDRRGIVMSESFNHYPMPTADGTKVFKVFLQESVERQYATHTSLEVAGKFETTDELLAETITTQTHDQFGNVTLIKTLTNGTFENADGNAATISQEKTVSSSYKNPAGGRLSLHAHSLTYEQLGRLTSTTVTGARDGENQLEKKVSFTYYQNGLLRTEKVEPDLVGDDKKRFQLVTTHIYDVFGNETGTEIEGWDGQTQVTRSSTREFDIDGRFLITTKDDNKNGRETYSEFNRYGTPKTITSINGSIAELKFDPLNREISAESNTASGVAANTYYLNCSQVSDCPTGAQYVISREVDQNANSREYFDKIGRVIRKAKQNFHGDWVYVDTKYDILGRAFAVSEPHDGRANYWTTSEYDDLGRVLKIIAPAAAEHNNGRAETSFAYDGALVTTTNPLNRRKVEGRNSFGELMWVRDEIQSESHAHLRYVYNAEGNMRRVEKYSLVGGVITTTLEYDRHNRKIAMNDPDKGAWRYFYNAFGELITQIDAKGQVVVNRYDNLGRMLSRIDRKKSTTADELAGEVEAQTRWYYDGNTDNAATSVSNAIGNVSAIVMSRTAGNHICSVNNSNVTQCQYPEYDSFGRQTKTVSYLDADLNPTTALEVFSSEVLFDSATGKVVEEYDAMNGLVKDGMNSVKSGTRNSYNQHGYVTQTYDLQTDQLLYETTRVNVRGQVTEANVGPYGRYLHYNPATGNLERQIAYTGGLSANAEANALTIQHATYEWDILGNLESRHNQNADGNGDNRDLQESFCYDSLNRLIKTHIDDLSGACSNLSSDDQDLRYDSIGNIDYKRGVGSYTYDSVKKHAVRTAGSTSYMYDRNGNVESDSDRTFTYATFDKPTLITKGDYSVAFAYGINRSRYVQKETKAGQVQKVTAYLGNIERIYRPDEQGGTYEWRRQVGTGVIKTNTDADFVVADDPWITFIFKDHLGSVDVIADINGNVLQSMSFDPWGARRKEISTLPVLTATELFSFDDSFTSRGYTGHEMLDELGLIHMNGRIYDAKLARFLQADPFVQAAADVQMYNRYAYLRNNPLNATDPSGYFLKRLAKEFGFAGSHYFALTGDFLTAYQMNAVNKQLAQNNTVAQWAPTVAGVVSAAFCGPCGIGVSAMVTADITYYRTGSWSSAARAGAVSAAYGAVTYGIGQGLGANFQGNFAGGLSGTGYALKVLAHGMVGGVMAKVQGGNFGNGFISAGFSAAASTFAPGGDGSGQGDFGTFVQGLVVSALVGGTSSAISGGKFTNGARSGAIVYALNSGTEKVKNAQKESPSQRLRRILNGVKGSHFRGQATDGVDVKILLADESLAHGVMQVPDNSSDTIVVSPVVLAQSDGDIALSFGHELVHLNDQINLGGFAGGTITHYRSEIKAYKWMLDNASSITTPLGWQDKLYIQDKIDSYQMLIRGVESMNSIPQN